MIRDTPVRLKGGRDEDVGRVLVTSFVSRKEKHCMVLWEDTRGLRYSWEREDDLEKVQHESR